jgi:hypothetical protein
MSSILTPVVRKLVVVFIGGFHRENYYDFVEHRQRFSTARGRVYM